MSRGMIEATKRQPIEELQLLASETEALLQYAVDTGSHSAEALRDGVEGNLAMIRTRLRSLQHSAENTIQATVQATDNYVRERPWQVIGVAAGLAVAIGVAISLLSRRR